MNNSEFDEDKREDDTLSDSESIDTVSDVDYGQKNAERVQKSTFQSVHERGRARRRNRMLATIALGIAATIILGEACVSLFCNIAEITVEGDTRYTNEEVVQACGLEPQTNLYAIDKAQIEREITTALPYIKDVKIRRRLPDTVALIVEEDSPVYYFELYGEYFLLSDTLRVLERTDEIAEMLVRMPNIVKLNTQTVIYAVVGSQIIFDNENYHEYAQKMLSTFLESSIGDKLTLIDFSDKFSIFVTYDNRLKIEVGDIDDIENKIRFAVEIISQLDTSYKGTINVAVYPAFFIME